MEIDLQFTTNVWSFISIFIIIYLLVLFAPFQSSFPTRKSIRDPIPGTGWHLSAIGWPTPLKNMTSSVGMMKFPSEWENKSHVPNHQPE